MPCQNWVKPDDVTTYNIHDLRSSSRATEDIIQSFHSPGSTYSSEWFTTTCKDKGTYCMQHINAFLIPELIILIWQSKSMRFNRTWITEETDKERREKTEEERSPDICASLKIATLEQRYELSSDIKKNCK